MSNKSLARRNRNKRRGEHGFYKYVAAIGFAQMHSTLSNKIIDGELKPVKEWERGDPGPAPISFVFLGTPPTEEEAPNGYITSSCGNEFQRSEALAYWGVVRIVLKPFGSLEVESIKKG